MRNLLNLNSKTKNENQHWFTKSRINGVITHRLCSGAKFARCKSITGPFFSSPDRRLPRLLRQSCSRQSRAVSRIVENAKSERPLPGHFIVLRHQEGDAWDYCVITHLGAKVTVDATPFQVPSSMRDVTDWHNDTFVNGPSWDQFTKAMAISDDTKSKSAGSVYAVSVFRPTAGHRDELEKLLAAPPNRPSDTSAGTVLMQHLEGGPWTFLTVVRYNSWQDFATNDMNNVTQSNKNEGGWFDFRQYSAYHTDTVTNRIAP